MKTKITLFMILIVLFTIIISQNSAEIEVHLLFWNYKVSEIVVIALTGFIGLLLGFILASIYSSASGKKARDTKKSEIKPVQSAKKDQNQKNE